MTHIKKNDLENLRAELSASVVMMEMKREQRGGGGPPGGLAAHMKEGEGVSFTPAHMYCPTAPALTGKRTDERRKTGSDREEFKK